MVVANSNNCSNCSMYECVNRQQMFFHPGHIYAQVSLPIPVPSHNHNFGQKIHKTGSKLKHLSEWIASYSRFNLEGPY